VKPPVIVLLSTFNLLLPRRISFSIFFMLNLNPVFFILFKPVRFSKPCRF
jgi:hypothetical protein